MFIAYDKDGKAYEYLYEIDQKEAVSRCGYTLGIAEKQETVEDQKFASKKELKAIKKLAKDNGVDLQVVANHLEIKSIDVLPKSLVDSAIEFIG